MGCPKIVRSQQIPLISQLRASLFNLIRYSTLLLVLGTSVLCSVFVIWHDGILLTAHGLWMLYSNTEITKDVPDRESVKIDSENLNIW